MASKTMKPLIFLAFAFALTTALGCSRVDEPQATSGTGTASQASTPKPKKLSWSKASAGNVAALVKAHMKKAEGEGRKPLVYVGGASCEPCRRFHHAAETGQLDDHFGDLAILEFDAESDGERLEPAGYTSTYIPLFVVPGADGRATDRKMSGSIKGEGAVAEITPRLDQLLGR